MATASWSDDRQGSRSNLLIIRRLRARIDASDSPRIERVCTAPLIGALSYDVAKCSAEMGLVAPTTDNGDLRERVIRGPHHLARKLDSTPRDVPKGRHANARLECPAEVTLAQIDQARQIA